MSGRVTYNPATGRCQWAQYSASPGRALYNGGPYASFTVTPPPGFTIVCYANAPGSLANYSWTPGVLKCKGPSTSDPVWLGQYYSDPVVDGDRTMYARVWIYSYYLNGTYYWQGFVNYFLSVPGHVEETYIAYAGNSAQATPTPPIPPMGTYTRYTWVQCFSASNTITISMP